MVSALGPSPGARLYLAVTEPSTLRHVELAQTGLDGRFTANVPDATQEVRIVVAAPGFPLSVERRRIVGEEELLLEIWGDGGELRIELPTDPGERSRGIFQLEAEAGEIEASVLVQWAAGNGRSLDNLSDVYTLPRLAAGTYVACFTPQAMLVEALGDVADLGVARRARHCRSGFLADGGVLTLDLR